MKHISVLLPQGSTVIDTVIAPYNLLRMANGYFQRTYGREVFSVDLVSVNDELVEYQGLISVSPTKTIEEIEKTDLIIVSAISGDLEKEITNNHVYIDWIRKQRIEHDTEVASLCKGAILLAETGLLNGKSCATHWTAHNFFTQRYPEVKLMPDKIICEDNGIYTSGGAYSFLNFIIYLIEKYCGRETAIWCAKVSEIDIDRVSQNQFMIFSGQKEHGDEQIKAAQEYIEKHFEENIQLDKLSEKVSITPRTFLRRFKKATSNTPMEYLRRVKVEVAKKRLESTAQSIQEVMYSIGYIDDKAFRTTFKKYTGLSPQEYRNKYNREMAMI